MPSKTISTANGMTQTAGSAVSLILSTVATPIITSIKGYCKGNATPGATQYWLQFFNAGSAGALAGLTALYELQILSSDGFLFDFSQSPINMVNVQNYSSAPGSSPPGGYLATSSWVANNGLIVAVSSTATTYTAPVDGCVADIFVEVESDGLIAVPGYTQIGDLTTNRSQLFVSADGNSNSLIEFYAVNNSGSAGWVQLFGYSPAVALTPITQWGNTSAVNTAVPNGGTIYKQFGRGLRVYQQDASLTNHTAIYIAFSSTQYTFTAQTGWKCWATYV